MTNFMFYNTIISQIQCIIKSKISQFDVLSSSYTTYFGLTRVTFFVNEINIRIINIIDIVML